MALEIGCSHQLTFTVQIVQTGLVVGSGDVPVFATPRFLAAMESAALQAVAPELEEGMTSVGTLVEMRHLAATPVGGEVTVEAKLVAIDKRQLTFEIVANDGENLIGKATHQRVMVNRDRFVEAATS